MAMPTILLTGATGYIGSHTWLALATAGFEVLGVDDFSNSSPQVLERLQVLLGHVPQFERASVCDAAAMAALLRRHRIDAAVHFAASKSVGESVARPLAYYANNLGGLIGEDPRGTPNNLMPYVAQVAVGRQARLQVFGHDYPTPDGTGVRDYIHVMDLADGHVAALRRLFDAAGSFTVNLGTGIGHSVLELVRAYEQASGRPVPYVLAPRRPGDAAACYADPRRATELLGWRARRDLATMCADSWRWQQLNPAGLSTV